MSRPPNMTEAGVLACISEAFPQPTYVTLHHVRNGTGWQRGPRTIDALAIGCWPSRGLVLWGFEVKVTRSDFRRELKDADKAESLAKYLDRFYIAAPEGVVPIEEVPPAWGLYEVKGGKLKLTREARDNPEPKPLDRLLLAAIARAATSDVVPKSNVDRMVEEQLEARLAPRIAQAQRQLEQEAGAGGLRQQLDMLRAQVSSFEAAAGFKLDQWGSRTVAHGLVDALAFRGPMRAAERVRMESERLASAAKQLKKDADELEKFARTETEKALEVAS